MIKFIQVQIENYKKGQQRHKNNLANIERAKIEDPYNLRNLRFYAEDIGRTLTIRTVLRREEHGNVFMSTKKNPYTNVVVRYVNILVIDETECRIVSVKEVKEYIEPSSSPKSGLNNWQAKANRARIV